MAAQAENLPDSCAKIYMQQCKQFFANGSSDRENTFLAHKEGATNESRPLSYFCCSIWWSSGVCKLLFCVRESLYYTNVTILPSDTNEFPYDIIYNYILLLHSDHHLSEISELK